MRQIFASALLVFTVACGGGDGGGGNTPTAPTPPPPPANRPPSITSMSVTGFGIQSLSQFTYQAAANDLDGDNVTYTWDVAGNERSGSSGMISFSNGGEFTARLTVADGKGGTATDTRSFIVGSMTGRWNGSYPGYTFTSNLNQSGGSVTGDYSDVLGSGTVAAGFASTIDSDGNIVVRYKQGIFTDFTLRGRMDQTGRRITGGIFGSGYNGEAFVMTKQ